MLGTLASSCSLLPTAHFCCKSNRPRPEFSMRSRTRVYAHVQAPPSSLRAGSTLYELLELSPDVSPFDIKQAYRQMARKYHPDVSSCSSEESTRRFIEIQEAYETLSDPGRRAMYDHAVAMGKGPAASGRASWRASEKESPPSEWRLQWEMQLAGLKRRSAMKHGQNDSWSAQVRRRKGL